MLEQEVVQREELEVECQRLKDEVRGESTIQTECLADDTDANSEIAILRDQMTRSVPTPPSSVSVPISPAQPPSNLPPVEIASSIDSDDEARVQRASPPRPTLPKSNTTASISSMASPSVRRTHPGLTKSPSGLPSLARSTNTRNLVAVAGPSSPSPFGRSANHGSVRANNASPARAVSATSAKSKGFRLLHELQAKLKATDDKLGNKVPKRNVSNPMPLAPSKRNVSAASTSTVRAPHARVQALAGDSTPLSNEKSSILSPNGWIMVDDEVTPVAQMSRTGRAEPASPLEPMSRAASQASQKSTSSKLPSRPGIPSPLTTSTGHGGSHHNLNKSTSRLPQRTPSRAGTSSLSQSVRPQSQADYRPMSPSMIPRPASSMMHALASSSHAASNSTPTSRANSQTTHRSLGRGPPPKAFPNYNPIKSSISTSTGSNPALRKSTRRSSVGAPELALSTGLPQPRTPNRPVSVPSFDGLTPPPPVPRIPSVHLRESKKGQDATDRRKSLLNR